MACSFLLEPPIDVDFSRLTEEESLIKASATPSKLLFEAAFPLRNFREKTVVCYPGHDFYQFPRFFFFHAKNSEKILFWFKTWTTFTGLGRFIRFGNRT